jgi:hypothetical protein
MAGHIPADVFNGASFYWANRATAPFQGELGEYVEAGGAGMLMRQQPRHGGCLDRL